MKKIFLFIITSTCLAINGFCGQPDTIPQNNKAFRADTIIAAIDTAELSLAAIKPVLIDHLEIPNLHPNETITFHTSYSLCFNEKHEQANWVAYKLTNLQTKSVTGRTDKFIADPLIVSGTATNADFKNSGFDRGHLAPAADMGWSTKSMQESFYYSNMSPQVPRFNRGIWKKLEQLVRSWAVEYSDIYIVTGPVLEDDLRSIGPDKVSVPKYFYKVILEYNAKGVKGIGFVLANRASTKPLQNYCVTIDSVEHLTGIDFFPLLPDKQEAVIERTLHTGDWLWSVQKTKAKKKKVKVPKPASNTTIQKGSSGKTRNRVQLGVILREQMKAPNCIKVWLWSNVI